jgi:hypothetical protein
VASVAIHVSTFSYLTKIPLSFSRFPRQLLPHTSAIATSATFKAWYAKAKELKLEGVVLSELGWDMHGKGALPQWPPTGAQGALQKGQLLEKLLECDPSNVYGQGNWGDVPCGEDGVEVMYCLPVSSLHVYSHSGCSTVGKG